MSIAKSAGAAIAIMVGLIICVIIFKAVNTNKKVWTEYDERQKNLRGKGYMISFYTIVAYEAVMMIITMSGVSLPIQDYMLHMAGIFLGCTVLCTYCIWNDVYWGLNNDPKKYMLVFAIALAINVAAAVGFGSSSGFMEDGKIGFPALNVMVIIMMVIILIELFIKQMIRKDEDSGEE